MALASPPSDIPAPPVPCSPLDEVDLGVNRIPQDDHTLLCWAACTTMVAQFYQRAATLRAVVERARPDLGSCANLDICNIACTEADVLRVYGLFQITGNLSQDPLSQSDLQQELAARRPVEIGYGSCVAGNLSGHLIIVSGFYVVTDGITFLVDDPEPAGKGTASYQGLLKDQNGGLCWRRTWSKLRPS